MEPLRLGTKKPDRVVGLIGRLRPSSESAVVGRHVVGALGLLTEAAIFFFKFGHAGGGGGGLSVSLAEGGGSGFEVSFGLLLLGDRFLQFGAVTEAGEFGGEFVDAVGGVGVSARR